MPTSQAIIDIGSNSVRLVVYDGPARAPAVLFNEKVMAGLGASLEKGGMLDPAAVEIALRALARFKAVTDAMTVGRVRTVATAAVRDASDGPAFIDRARACGFAIEILSGEDEARAAGHGVIAAIPEADGIVGDLGGGSLELVRISGGRVRDRVSLPLGVLRLPAIRARGRGALDRYLKKALDKAGWSTIEAGLPFYLVGGSWRALARLHMHLTDYPLPVLHNYSLPPAAAVRLVRAVSRIGRKNLKAIEAISSTRVPALADAAALLATITRQLGSGSLVVSAFGLREGLLYAALDAGQQAQDPLIAATRAAGARQGRFTEHGDLLAQWIAPLFGDEPASLARLRHAACLLGDVAWAASPEFRAERGLDVALHGNWVGIDARGRAMIAQALYTSFGGGTGPLPILALLTSAEDRAQALAWGLAMRLGQRLSGGVAGPLTCSSLALDDSSLILRLPVAARALYGDAVERRHRQIATLFSREARLWISEA
jgi:exopolyphosphatase / guanosine-5'-triphosphate,3'-diphosphate pyrophosphatase